MGKVETPALQLKSAASTRERRASARSLGLDRQTISAGKYQRQIAAACAALYRSRFIERLWRKDPTLWKSGARHLKIIRNSLGWLDAPELMAAKIAELEAFAVAARADGFTDAVLLGMGGASVCAEVLARTFQKTRGAPANAAGAAVQPMLRLSVIDSTVPETIAQVTSDVDAERALFIVASKSGTTLETLSLYRTFYQRMRKLRGAAAGSSFVAITDLGTNLEQLARERRFRRTFLNPADIGGRHSALSYFGLVPAALIGVDLRTLLARAIKIKRDSMEAARAEDDSGASLGAMLGALHAAGRDKLTIIASPPIAGFALWAEQMIAESTGKEGVGLVPVCGEPLGRPREYGKDRAFVYLKMRGDADPAQERCVRALAGTGAPIVTIRLADKFDLGGEFMRWEVAAAAAAHLMNIDPFDEPNVQESKDDTARVLRELERKGSVPAPAPLAELEGMALYGAGRRIGGSGNSPGHMAEALERFFRLARRGDYLAIMGYVEASEKLEAEVAGLRKLVRARTGLATTFGYGPRVLHSTGQLHKGGPANGLYLQLVHGHALRIPIPGVRYDFAQLNRAQYLGDFLALTRRRRRVIRVHLGGDCAAGMARLRRVMVKALR